MSEPPDDRQSIVSRYLRATTEASGRQSLLSSDEALWLIDHAMDIGAARLELLRALQTKLPATDDPGAIADLKELLTDLIVMQTRLSGREERLKVLLRQVADAGVLGRVPVEEPGLRHVLVAVLEASARVEQVAAEG